MEYATFLQRKSQQADGCGFEPIAMPDAMFDFQEHLTAWALRRGRSAIFADCGMGKAICQLTWADNVVRHTGGNVLILTPLAVARQTGREAEKFGLEATVSRDGSVAAGVTITNYEKLHQFDPTDFVGVVCDESSILKSYSGATRKDITRFMNKLKYRLLCTATPSPNDYVELGTSSEALGELNHSEMLKRFFRQLDDKGQKGEHKKQLEAEKLIEIDPNYYRKLSFRVSQSIGQWRLKHHGVESFWRWVASWAKACRMPSDLGFDDGRFILPPLTQTNHVIKAKGLPPGRLFHMPALGLAEEREERKRSLTERCEFVADLVDHDRPAVVWCHANAEGDLLESIIPDAVQVAGRTPDEQKIELYEAFESGEARVMVIKPKIGAWGLNWQHCNHVVSFASHSYEQFYQSIRRCWRFGQESPVQSDVIATEGEIRVVENMERKAAQAEEMFKQVVRHMNGAETIERVNPYVNEMEVPAWL